MVERGRNEQRSQRQLCTRHCAAGGTCAAWPQRRTKKTTVRPTKRRVAQWRNPTLNKNHDRVCHFLGPRGSPTAQVPVQAPIGRKGTCAGVCRRRQPCQCLQDFCFPADRDARASGSLKENRKSKSAAETPFMRVHGSGANPPAECNPRRGWQPENGNPCGPRCPSNLAARLRLR